MIISRIFCLAAGFAAGLLSTSAVWAAAREELRVPGADPGIEIRVIHKAPAEKARFADGEVVLMLHPYGVPTADAYDVASFSWMDDLTGRGLDVWAMDFRGFGGSTRPEGTTPVVYAADAARDVAVVARRIASQRGVSKISLVGWSWGGVVAPMVAAANPDLVQRLAVFGAMHSFNLPFMTKPLEDPARTGLAVTFKDKWRSFSSAMWRGRCGYRARVR